MDDIKDPPPDNPLQPHQRRVRDRMLAGDNRLLLYHGLGTGKSRAAIVAAEAAGGPYAAVTPASLRDNFAKEQGRWGHAATPSSVMSYTALGAGRAPTVEPETVILDEAQRLRAPDSAQSRAAAALAARAPNLLLLSGTPIVNSPGDLASPLNMLAGTHYTPDSFEKRFVGRERISPGLLGWLAGVKPEYRTAVKHEHELEGLLRGHVDYEPSRSPEGVTSTDRVVDVELDRDQDRFNRLLYGRLPMLLRWRLRHQYPLSTSDLRNLRSFLVGGREAGLSMLPFRGGLTPDQAFEGSSKLRAAGKNLLETLRDPRKKALVFSNFIGAGLEPYDAFLTKQKIPHAVFSGGISDADRRRIVEDYNRDKLRVLLLGPSGAEGLSTRGSSLVQMLDPAWNESRMQQSRGRALRFDSHEGLPPELRNVMVERYRAHPVKPGLLGRMFGSTAMPTADEIISRLSEGKEDVNERFRDVLRRVGQEGKAAGVIGDLKDVKRLSDKKDYGAKHRALRALMDARPHEFHVDSHQGAFAGITHTSGFRFHLPRRYIPDVIRRELKPDVAEKAAVLGIALTPAVLNEALRPRTPAKKPKRRRRPAPPLRPEEPDASEVLSDLVTARRARRPLKAADWRSVPDAVVARLKCGFANPLQSVQAALGGPSALTNALVYGTMGAGLGHLGGLAVESLADQWLPEDMLEEGKARRVGTGLGAALGGLGWPAYRWSVAERAGPTAGQPLESLSTAWPWRPEDAGEKSGADMRAGFLAAALEGIELPGRMGKLAADSLGQTGALFIPSIPVDAFNNAVWNDVNSAPNPFGSKSPWGDDDQPMGTPPHVAAAASGAVAAAGAVRGSGYVSPWDVAVTIGSAAGTGWLGGLALGKAVGMLAGLSPSAQQQVQRAGLWAGLLSGGINAAFGH